MELLATLAGAATPADFAAARQQMAFTLGFHIVLASIGIGLPAITLLAEWRSLRTGDQVYAELARRWMKAAGVLFAVGAVSGTVLSFEMGTLWPGFMDKYGQVFGAAFALEGIAFFIEAIFMGIYLYGWDRLPPKVHFLTGIPVVIAGLLSASFVVTVNAWMNQPRGFTLVDGQVTEVDPIAAMLNPNTPVQAAHLILASLMVCGFTVASVYAVALLRDHRAGRPLDPYHRRGFAIPFTLGAVCAPLQVLVGDWAVRHVHEYQPIKFAAMEGIEHTAAGVPFKFAIFEIPGMLSLMTTFDPNGVLRGLDSFPADVRPPAEVVRIGFELMIAIGTALLALAAWWAFTWWRHRRGRRDLPWNPWFLRLAALAGVGAIIAMEAGWTTTEVGRQPWIVYGVMRTEEAVNPSPGLRFGLYVVLAVYAVLAVATVSVLRRMRRRPQEPTAEARELEAAR
ncbi:cytochrome bd-I ubiquinol oxidase subunit 1 apoprotein [Thermomonospora echinospora]|uniref:Cytochrome bd-I ubiquinol oxidase subunit 1 apoprotein n=1 Tax=Thermomonospora echinospora TaxID=1992 RepID=A0A1H6DKA7_9ACTN|nr:cytochrome ubiquinol oxidase subunit I [Thermomonospora echinospora]SEG85867.1 cytochrome bd-I ubiquinol oxidase subunit 1 apoprotein [Thermomonospora echinospora]